MFMHICIHHYTNASPLQSSKWILIALKNETHSPTAPSKTWLLPIFLSPNLTTLLCPECSLLPSLHLVPEHAKPSLASVFCTCSCLFHSFTALSLSICCFLPQFLCLNLNAPPISFIFPIEKKSHSRSIIFFSFTILISAYNDFVSSLCLCHYTVRSVKARNIYLSHYYILNSKRHAWLVHNKSSISVF